MLEGAWMHDVPRAVDWAVGAAWLIRREALDAVGPLDESFFMYVEDVEWCWRASRKGWQIWFEPAAVIRHVGNASGEKRFGNTRTRVYLANTYRFYRREHGTAAAIAYRAVNLIGSGRRYIAARIKGDKETAGYWRGYLRANLPTTREQRPRR